MRRQNTEDRIKKTVPPPLTPPTRGGECFKIPSPSSNKGKFLLSPSPLTGEGKGGGEGLCPWLRVLCSKKGLTLIEVMVAIVILAIGLIGVALMQYVAIGGNAFGREMQIATELGQERLEMIKSTAYANVASGNEPLADPDPSRFGGLTFTRVWWVVNNCRNPQVNDPNPNIPVCNPVPAAACAGGATMANMGAIAVRVCWVDKNGGNHSVTLNGVKWDETATP